MAATKRLTESWDVGCESLRRKLVGGAALHSPPIRMRLTFEAKDIACNACG